MSTTPATTPPNARPIVRTAVWSLVILAVSTTLSVGTAQAIDPSGELLGALTPVNQMLPALSLVVALLIVRPGRALRTIALTPLRPWRNSLGGSMIALATTAAVPLIAVAVGVGLSVVEVRIPETWLTLSFLVAPVLVLNAVLSLGEEVLWRGWLQSAWSHWGWFRSTLVISLIWAVWHLPLVATYTIAEGMPAHELVITSVQIVFFGLLLGALRSRFDSVWPAVFGHAAGNTFGPLVNSNVIVGGLTASPQVSWTIALATWAAFAGLAVVLRRSQHPRAMTASV
ncbi:CPBP family intramembrane glutamic endopeptidase [Microbacterium sp.]|uniref:CPBP family intramembrane glutamic endopeptidase n=1 Tax=Microbacterium sp. TaxID=51671 RepID=UPI003A83FAF9